jgi:two-component system chemotaxis response regulator CheB
LKNSIPNKIVLIGASTGGPGHIEKIISSLPILTDTTIIIAQHMVDEFISNFTDRLKEFSKNSIKMAENNSKLNVANVYLCEGLTTVVKKDMYLSFNNKPSAEYNYNPDINTVFNSFVPFTKNIQILSVILTGIGEDGIDGCKNLSINGARALTEDQKSAIVDGMPFRARKNVPNIEVSDINEIVNKIKEFCS